MYSHCAYFYIFWDCHNHSIFVGNNAKIFQIFSHFHHFSFGIKMSPNKPFEGYPVVPKIKVPVLHSHDCHMIIMCLLAAKATLFLIYSCSIVYFNHLIGKNVCIWLYTCMYICICMYTPLQYITYMPV